jgi:biopolymer transport protein TolQ
VEASCKPTSHGAEMWGTRNCGAMGGMQILRFAKDHKWVGEARLWGGHPDPRVRTRGTRFGRCGRRWRASRGRLRRMAIGLVSLAMMLFQDAPDAAAGAPVGAHTSAIADMLHNSGPTAMTVLAILLVMSVFSWAVMIAKWRMFQEADAQNKRFLRAFRKSARLSEIAAVADQFRPSPLVAVFHEITDEYQRQSGGRGTPPNPAALERAAQTAASEGLTAMERRLTWLATIAQVAPFVGLFGTVMGIIDAFHGLGTAGAATLRAVAPGISEALITTAAGLIVAVPAVMGYNQLTARLRVFGARMDDFGRELLNAIENAALAAPQALMQERPEERRPPDDRRPY